MVPGEALDKELDCAAFSKKKEKWYDRVLVFRADSLPADALTAAAQVTAASLGLADGTYTVEVSHGGRFRPSDRGISGNADRKGSEGCGYGCVEQPEL